MELKKATKKQKCLDIFNDAIWYRMGADRCKTISYEMLQKSDLRPTIEYQEKYCDAIYLMRVIKALGYKVLVGSAIHVYDRDYYTD